MPVDVFQPIFLLFHTDIHKCVISLSLYQKIVEVVLMIFCFVLSVLDVHFPYGGHRTETLLSFSQDQYRLLLLKQMHFFVNFGLFFVNVQYQKAKVASQQ